MTSEGQEPSQTQQPPSRPASVVSRSRPASPPSKEPSQTPKAFTPVLDIVVPDLSDVSAPPTKRRSLSPLPPSAQQGDTFQSPFNASFHSHSLPPSVNAFTTAPEGPSNSTADPNKQLNPRPYNRPGFKMQNPGVKIASERKPSLDDGALLEAILAKEEERKRSQSVVKPVRKGSRTGESHRRTSSGGLTTIPYIPKGFRNIMANEPAQTPLMQAIHNPISLDTGPPSSNSGFGSSAPRLQSPHQAGPPKLGLNTQLGSRTGTPEPGSSATPPTGASPGSPMGRRKPRAPGDIDKQSQPGSAKPRARQRSLLPKSASIQFESVPYPYPNSESTVFVQVSPRPSTTSIQFQPIMSYAPPMPPGHPQLLMSNPQPPPPPPPPPPPLHGSPPPPGPGPVPAGHPSSHPPSHHGVYMSPIGPPPPPPFGPLPPGYSPYSMHQSVPPQSPSAQSQTLPPPHRAAQVGSGNPFSGNGSYPPPEFRPIDYGHSRGPQPPLPRHEFSPIMSNAGVHPDGLRKALFPQHERPLERKQSITRTTPFSGPPSTFMEEVTSPTASQFHTSSNLPNFERRDQPIVAPKSPSPVTQQGLHEQQRGSKSSFSLGPPLHFITQNVSSSFFHQDSSSPHPSLSLNTTSLPSPTKEQSSFLPQPTTPPMARTKTSIDRGRSVSKTSSSSAQRISISGKSQHPQSPITPKAENSSMPQRENQVSPAAPMIKRRSAYVAGGGIKTTDLALPKPDVIELALSPEAMSAVRTTSEDPEQILTLNKPRKRNRANPSVLRTREKEVDDASPEPTDDPDGQLTRETNDAENRDSVEVEDEPEMKTRQRPQRKDSKEQKEENQRPARKKRAVRNKFDLIDIDADDEEMEDAPRPYARRRGRKGKQPETAPSPVSEYNSETEEEEEVPVPVIGKRTRKATTRAIKGAEQFPKRRRTRKVIDDENDVDVDVDVDVDAEANDAGAPMDYISATSGAESTVPSPPVVKKPGRRGRKPREAKVDKPVYSTASDGDSTGDRRPQLFVNGKPIRLPTPPPGVRKPGLVNWYRFRERPKFSESDEMLDTIHTIRRLKDRERLHHLKTSVNFFNSHTLVGEDGWTDTEQELEKMGKAKPVDTKVGKTALWAGQTQISDAAFEQGFQQLDKQGSVEPVSAAETPRIEFPPAPSRQQTNLSIIEPLNDGGVDTPMDDAAPSTAIATPMVELDLEDLPFKVEDKQDSAQPSQPFIPPNHTQGFHGAIGAQAPEKIVYNHTERKRKPLVFGEVRSLKNVTWTLPHMEGRSKEILKQTLDLQAERRKEKAKAEAEAQAAIAAEDAKAADKLKPKRGGRRGKKKTKGDLKNLAYAREVRRAKLEGAKIHTPADDDNLSVVSGSLGGDGGDAASDATLDDDELENSDHSSDWSPEEEDLETPEMIGMEDKYQAAMADPATKQFLEEYGPKLFPNIYELPENATRNRAPEYTDAADFSAAIDLALEIDDQELLQSVLTHTVSQYAMVTDEKQKLESYQVKRGFIKQEALIRRLTNLTSKRKAEDAGLDDLDEASAPRYSTRRRTVRNPDGDEILAMSGGYNTPRVASSGSLLGLQERIAMTPEREPRPYKPRGGRGRGGGRGASKAAADAKKVGSVPGDGTGTGTTAAPSTRGGGRGRGGRGRGRGRGRQVT